MNKRVFHQLTGAEQQTAGSGSIPAPLRAIEVTGGDHAARIVELDQQLAFSSLSPMQYTTTGHVMRLGVDDPYQDEFEVA